MLHTYNGLCYTFPNIEVPVITSAGIEVPVVAVHVKYIFLPVGWHPPQAKYYLDHVSRFGICERCKLNVYNTFIYFVNEM